MYDVGLFCKINLGLHELLFFQTVRTLLKTQTQKIRNVVRAYMMIVEKKQKWVPYQSHGSKHKLIRKTI